MEDKTLEQPTMSLYEYSKQVVANEVPMDPILFNKKMIEVSMDMVEHTYMMLLCHDRRDYTIFHITNADKKIATKEISETLYNRGKILLVDKQKDGSWEIWIRDSLTDENFAYYLFPYDNGVVEVE